MSEEHELFLAFSEMQPPERSRYLDAFHYLQIKLGWKPTRDEVNAFLIDWYTAYSPKHASSVELTGLRYQSQLWPEEDWPNNVD